ncbi:EXG1, partial [Symbiodinium microadriaticum]
VEKVRHNSVRQLVLSCIKVMALHHFDAVMEELLGMGPDFNTSIMAALQVMAKENSLLLIPGNVQLEWAHVRSWP